MRVSLPGRLMVWRSVRLALATLASITASSLSVQASVTYTYTAPLLFSNDPGGNNSTLTIEFTTTAPLAPATIYSALPDDSLSSSLTVSSAYTLGNYHPADSDF